jgi:hypothetical protein
VKTPIMLENAHYTDVVAVVGGCYIAGQSLIVCSTPVAFDHACSGRGCYTVDLCSGAHWPLHMTNPQGVG